MTGLDRAATVADLPDGALVNVFGHLKLVERHRTAALVCKRWWQAANSPPLVRSLDIRIIGRWMPRLRALAEWVPARAAPHVQTLRLEVGAWPFAHEMDQQEATATLPAILAACGAAGQLSELQLAVRGSIPLPIGGWLGPLGHSLRALTVDVVGQLFVASMPALPALQRLVLLPGYNSRITIQPAARLPGSLTKLQVLRPESADVLLPQVGTLSRLVDLSCRGATFAADGFSVLTRLTALRRLDLDGCAFLPLCLSQLTGLEALDVSDAGGAEEEAAADLVRAALPRLTGLTSLALSCSEGMLDPPTELAGLTSLRRFAWRGYVLDGAELELPGGAWLARLERLVGPSVLLSRCLPQLAAATQLEQLGVDDSAFEEANDRDYEQLIAAVRRHPRLRRLVLQNMMECDGLNAAFQAQRERPTLRIEIHAAVFSEVFVKP